MNENMEIDNAPSGGPHNMMPEFDGFLYHEHVEQTFNRDLFYIAAQEQKLVDRLVNLDEVAAKLQNAGVDYRPGALIFGPEGSGKTALAKYVALTMQRPFFMVNISDILMDASSPGEARRNIVAIFQREKFSHERPLLFLDDIQALTIGLHNDQAACMANVVPALLQAMDLLPKDVLVLAGTSRIQAVPDPVRRLFHIEHEFDGASQENKEQMVAKYLKSVKEKSTFNIDWDATELSAFIKQKSTDSNSELISTMVQLIADTVEKGRTKLRFPQSGSVPV